jgi:SAM-dependent MidA family methyltransferase
MNYADFSRLALYHPELGYYRARRKRVGKTGEADFYTASSHSDVFPQLVWEAARVLCERGGWQANEVTFVELGAEPEQDPWRELPCPFASYRQLRLGDGLILPKGPLILYSNELFDAQPFYRWFATGGKWHPIHLQCREGQLREVLGKAPLDEAEARCAAGLPCPPEFDYHLDVSTAAVDLLRGLCEQPWQGVFLAFDYGTSRRNLQTETPQGSARAYRSHQQETCLFAAPGEQDLTTHVCWDDLEAGLREQGFADIRLRYQSRFLMEEATAAIQPIVTQATGLTDKRKSQLLELISPGFFGQKFQVLSAVRKGRPLSD